MKDSLLTYIFRKEYFMSEILISALIGVYFGSIGLALFFLVCNILGENEFIFETFRIRYYIEQIKSLYEDGGLYCPFSPDKRKKYTKFGLYFLSILWILTFGIAFIPALIISYIIWALYWLFIKLCIKSDY